MEAEYNKMYLQSIAILVLSPPASPFSASEQADSKSMERIDQGRISLERGSKG